MADAMINLGNVKGTPGQDGQDGQDGTSVTVKSVERDETKTPPETTVTLTDGTRDTSFTIKDGVTPPVGTGSLTLEDGYTLVQQMIRKFGPIVIVNLSVQKNTGYFPNEEVTVATLGVGFRPASPITGGLGFTAGSPDLGVRFFIYENGQITIKAPGSVHGCFSATFSTE